MVEHFQQKALVLTYNRHAYGLGEHYNLVGSSRAQLISF